MKKNYSIILFIAVATALSFKTYATKFTVTASNFQFSPPTVNATVGDTILWVLGGGSHTTTCNGNSGTSLPAGAATWNSPLNGTTTSFEYVLTVAGNYHYVCLPHAPSMAGDITVAPANGIADLNKLVNYLEINPPTFKSSAIIKFSLAFNAHIKLSIYDFAGRKIQTLLDDQFNKGEHTAQWDADRIPQGIYFCRLENEEYTLTKKFVRIK